MGGSSSARSNYDTLLVEETRSFKKTKAINALWSKTFPIIEQTGFEIDSTPTRRADSISVAVKRVWAVDGSTYTARFTFRVGKRSSKETISTGDYNCLEFPEMVVAKVLAGQQLITQSTRVSFENEDKARNSRVDLIVDEDKENGLTAWLETKDAKVINK